MSEPLKVVTNRNKGDFSIPTQGTKVTVGGLEIKGLLNVNLVADQGDVWRLKLEFAVDPNALFVEAGTQE